MQTVFIHGLGQNASSWEDTITNISTKNNIQCPDLWDINKNKEITYHNLYQSFAKYCDNTPFPLNLCGISLGSIIALNYAIDYPKKVISIIIIGAKYKMPKTLLKLQNLIFRLMPNKSFDKMNISKNNTIKLMNSMMDIDFTSKLSMINLPTLIICGEKDSANMAASKYISCHIPNSQFKVIENATHEVNTITPKKLSDLINSFLANFQ